MFLGKRIHEVEVIRPMGKDAEVRKVYLMDERPVWMLYYEDEEEFRRDWEDI